MTRITIDQGGTHLLRDGQAFPLIVDTAWGALANATLMDWKYYTARRHEQGFTAVAVSMLPVLHDQTVYPESRHPYRLGPSGNWDFKHPNESYFANAREFGLVAAENGLLLAVVLLWCNYIPGTWGARLTPGAVMSTADRRAYVSQALEAFHGLDALTIVSGDDNFDHPDAIAAYSEALAQVAEEAPHSLTAMHSTPDAELPAQLAESPDLDLYVYQSGHDIDRQQRCADLAARYLAQPVRRPVVNLEPCYEQLGYGGGKGRFTREDVRRATWWSMLGGAAAGIGYGAHGLWQWHVPDGVFTNAKEYLQPFPWQTALGLPGAEDVTFAFAIWSELGLFGLMPRQDLLGPNSTDVRIAADSALCKVAMYLPHAASVTILADLSFYEVRMWSLKDRKMVRGTTTTECAHTQVHQLDINGDVVAVFVRPPVLQLTDMS